MLDLLLIPLLLQVALPAGLLLWLALGRPRDGATWLMTVVLATGCIGLIAKSGLWLMLPAWLPAAYAALLLAAAAVSLRRLRAIAFRPRGSRAVAGLVLRGGAIVVVAALLAHVARGRRPPSGELVDLAFPLRSRTPAGRYLVVNGGSVTMLNAHRMTRKGERFTPYRGQSHAVDLVRTDRRGRRARGALPRDPAAYVIFGDSVVAPCTGRVAVAEDGHPDMPPPEADLVHLAGNHVIVACRDAWVLLGHLQRTSVRVTAGDAVHVGDVLGLVGNSGNTGEPHLHIHAQRPGTAAAPLGGEPLPIRLGGRYLVRNDRITPPGR